MILLLLVGLGLVLGSFVNALVWRLHEGRNWVSERSECPHCHHQLAAKDLIPVFSWLLLRGRCRYCKHKIEDSPLTELALPLLFAASYLFWPLALQDGAVTLFIMWCVMLVAFLILTVYDLRWFLLPNKVVFPLMGLAVVYVLAKMYYLGEGWPALLGAAVGVLIISGTFYAIFQISKGTWIGGGDVKLGVVLGLLAGGLLESLLLLFVASLAGTAAALPLIAQGKARRKAQIPFGPFLLLGLFVVVLFGENIISWYADLLAG